jgi:hypothetical protein
LSDEQISPELALVCPDLRAKAIAALPEEPWFGRPRRTTDVRTLRTSPATVARPGRRRRDGPTVARDLGAYVFARTTELVAIMAGTVLLVLLLAGISRVVRG